MVATQRPNIGGVKQSLELCQFDIKGPGIKEETVHRITGLLASRKINIDFLTYSSSSKGCATLTLCTAQNKMHEAMRAIKGGSALFPDCSLNHREHVATVSVFPLDRALNILGLLLRSCSRKAVPVYGIATSLSAISFITEYSSIENVLWAIRETFQLPENHSPLKPEIVFYQSDTPKR